MTTQKPTWLGRLIAHQDDERALETAAAINEFQHKMPRHHAEQAAYDEYVKEKRLDAAAHHLAGLKAAQAAGHMDEARKHGEMYDEHMRALGMNPIGPVPLEVRAKLDAASREKIYRFKAHGGDSLGASTAHDLSLGKTEQSGANRLAALYKTATEALELSKVAPPGFSEETMHKLKAKYGEESAFKIAWAVHKRRTHR